LEFAAGIPGTFGGVLWMNAGTRGGSIHQVFHSMDIVTPEGELRLLSAAEVTFTYRSSNLPSNHFILGGRVWVRPGDRNEINSEVAKIKAYRQNQPLEWPNAGSVFKNPKGDHAGRLIEACGLKGFRSGGAMISDKHANFIVNVENATADDVMKIIHKVQETVLKEHGVQLETEVELLQ
jgi:UDP-N-acetylmuramate dehydrogenase